MSEQRPDRYPIKITIKSVGKGLTSPRVGDHFHADNEPFMIGVAEGSLKYWVIDGKIVKGKVQILRIKGKDVVAEAHFSEETPPDLSLKGIENVIEKDISVTSGIKATHERNKSKAKRYHLPKTKEKEK